MERKSQTVRGSSKKNVSNTTNKNNKGAGTKQNINAPLPAAGGRGFASMDEDQQREIASKGGKASHGGGRKSGSTNPRGNGKGK
jgi:general stress protein YciG